LKQGFLTHKNATVVAVTAVALSLAAILYVIAAFRAGRVADVLAAYREHADYGHITVEYPLDETLFPPEMVPPVFRWKDAAAGSRAWLVQIEFADGAPGVPTLTRRQRWTPRPEDWETIKRRAREQEARVLILGVGRGRPVRVLSRARMSFRTSKDPVAAPLFYREVILPFIDADQDPSRIRWRFGSIASPRRPPVVLKDLPVCGNCHSFSRDGSTLAMDVDYAHSKASYVITAVKEQMVLTPKDIIGWDSYRSDDADVTFGLLSQISPDGRYVVSTVKDMSVFIPRPGLAFSQLFFPIRGILCVFDRETRQFRALPGADDRTLVQSNPTWSPDGKYIVFARTQAFDLSHTRYQGRAGITTAEGEEFVKDGKPVRFDLYRIPFNGGTGGTAVPLEGASNNGMSNYFARYSPDGRWIVFCRAKSYMLLQPDSALYIIPAQGGEARRLRCNTGRMNSWHSWSPNGKWLVFSSKAYSDYTQLFLTHIDEDGDSTPPVVLSHLTAPDRAANIPEFVNTHPGAIVRIRERFLPDR
jgi:hypothetical protein